MIPKRVEAANAIRKELKQAFHGVSFSVRSTSFAGGNSVSVEWTDGPTQESVEEIVGKYQYCTKHNGCDIYEITNERKDLPQTKFILINREFSMEVEMDALEICKERYSCFDGVNWLTDQTKEGEPVKRFLERYLKKMNLTDGIKPDLFDKIDS